MGRVLRWLKQLLTGTKEGHKALEEGRAAGEWNDGAEERKRWSFAKQRKSASDAGGRPSGPAAVVAAAESPQAKSRRRDGKEGVRGRREKAAVVIQKTFRGYLARKALRALRSLVKIQALVRGYLVRKQAAMTLHRLQTLMRLQADSMAIKNASNRRTTAHEEWFFGHEAMVKPPPATPVHRRMLSDSTDSNYERSPRIVEMDTCHRGSRSSRITGRYTSDPSWVHRPAPLAAPSCSPLPGKQHPARLSFRRSSHERDTRGPKTAHNTPRLASAPPDGSPAAKSVEYDGTTRRTSHRDALVSPRYMAGTASSAARTRCHSAPRQRPADAARSTLVTRAGSRRSCSQAQAQAQAHGGFGLQRSDASRTGCDDVGVSDEAARDYYLDTMW